VLAAQATPANQQERAQVGPLTAQVQQVAEQKVEVAFVDQGYTGESAATAAQANSMKLEVVSLPQAKHGFVLLPRRWVVERSFAWLARFRRLARDYERLPTTLVGLHFIIFACVMLARLVHTVSST
jgi:transposase